MLPGRLSNWGMVSVRLLDLGFCRENGRAYGGVKGLAREGWRCHDAADDVCEDEDALHFLRAVGVGGQDFESDDELSVQFSWVTGPNRLSTLDRV